MSRLKVTSHEDSRQAAPDREPLAKKSDEPVRQCLVTGEKCPKSDLLRFVGVGGVVILDVKGVLPGRGYWLKPSRAVVEQALKQRVFQKRSRGKLRAEDGLLERVEVALQAVGRVLQ